MADVPKYEYLPGIVAELNDGGLTPEAGESAPRVLVIGTAGKG